MRTDLLSRSVPLDVSINRSEPAVVSYLRAHIYLLSVLEFFLMSVDSLQEKQNKKEPINEC